MPTKEMLCLTKSFSYYCLFFSLFFSPLVHQALSLGIGLKFFQKQTLNIWDPTASKDVGGILLIRFVKKSMGSGLPILNFLLIKTGRSVLVALKKVKCTLNLIMNGLKHDIKVGIVYNYRRKENNEMIDLLGGNSVKI
jgi:hypothetical protein